MTTWCVTQNDRALDTAVEGPGLQKRDVLRDLPPPFCYLRPGTVKDLGRHLRELVVELPRVPGLVGDPRTPKPYALNLVVDGSLTLCECVSASADGALLTETIPFPNPSEAALLIDVASASAYSPTEERRIKAISVRRPWHVPPGLQKRNKASEGEELRFARIPQHRSLLAKLGNE